MPVLILCLLISLLSPGNISGEKDRGKSAGKRIILRLEPGPGNPRNSEGDFITLMDGRILFIYSRYTGGSGDDNDNAYLAGICSEDGGRTWSSESRMIIEQEGKMNVMSVSLLRLQNGEIALFYLRKNSADDCIPMIRLSDDETKTWSEPQPCIMDRKGYFVLNNGRVIQLRDGRLVLAVALHQEYGSSRWNNKGRLFSYYSDDNGRTWKAGSEVPNPGGIVTQEPGLVELRTGNIMMFVRTDAGVQYLSYSADRGESWSPVERSDIRSPMSPASIERIPSTGDLLMVWNNNGGEDPEMKGKRTPLTIAVSKDEGKTWERIKNIEDDPDGWYCYTAIHFTGRNVLLGYCAGNRPAGTGLAVTQITMLDLRWIYR
ncbi:MAG TPA: sialidase family protein [Bacteroidales bacterium]|jgi:photosystem II stability/assembly factor-like uncharacterized protein|nr:sialidase family protein [Bacteroidales bacterium]HQH23020.1 sialidase family protein [Bacteroidales bacterium]HQJ83536.1 sialidase family protein [Bacteroidales bacterium]